MTFTILTVEANALVKSIHHRMPAIVKPEDFGVWLDPEMRDVERLQSILAPYPDGLMEAYEIGRAVNSSRNDGVELMRPVGGG